MDRKRLIDQALERLRAELRPLEEGGPSGDGPSTAALENAAGFALAILEEMAISGDADILPQTTALRLETARLLLRNALGKETVVQ